MPRPRSGGSFAPPLSDDLLARYKALIDAQPESAVKDALGVLYRCAAAWWEQPESSGARARPHPTGAATIVELDEPIQRALWDAIPWREELDAMHGTDAEGRPRLLEALPPGELRHAAFHLLWHAIELERDREPLTSDKLSL